MRVKLGTPAPQFAPNVRDGIEKSANGHTYHYKDGRYHREDGPAIIYSYGEERWYYKGFLHRIGGQQLYQKLETIIISMAANTPEMNINF